MNSTQPNPFETAREVARRFSSPLARSALLVEIAKTQFAAGQIDESFKTIDDIPNRAEKRSLLLNLALDAIPRRRTETLSRLVRCLLQVAPESRHTAGRLALSLLEDQASDSPADSQTIVQRALELIALTEQPFDSDRSRYDFLAQLLEVGKKSSWKATERLLETFSDPNYRDWGRLALLKSSARENQWAQAEGIADSFSNPRRRSWAFFELSRMAPERPAEDYRNRAADILAAVAVESDSDPESLMPLVVQLRIVGKAALTHGEEDQGLKLLEQCEAVAARIPVFLERYRAQLFLAKVLRDFGQLDAVGDYLDVQAVGREDFRGIERSRLVQWIIEADAPRNPAAAWQRAVSTAAETDENALFTRYRPDEFAQAERIAEILRRYASDVVVQRSAETPKAVPTGDPKIDVDILSGEEFEEYYFSPFSIDDCGC